MGQQFKPPACELCQSRMESVFSGLEKEGLEKLTCEKSSQMVQRGGVIFHEGQRPSGLYCISQGKVKVYKIGDEGREQILRLDKPGHVLGYRALVSGEPYRASASAIEDSVICFIPAHVIKEALSKEPEVAMRMMRLFSRDLKNAENRLTDLTQKPVRERLAQTLLALHENYGITEEGNLDVYLTRQEMANFMGTTTETVIRTISEFNKEGLIQLNGKRIALNNKSALESMAEF